MTFMISNTVLFILLFISAPHTVLQECKKYTDNEPDSVDHSRIWFIVGVRIECYIRGHVELIEGYIGQGAE